MTLLAALLLIPQGFSPETDAVMDRARREKHEERAAERSEQAEEAAAPRDPLPIPEKLKPAFEQCMDTAIDNPEAGVKFAEQWRIAGGTYYARQCLGFAYSKQGRWAPAMVAFEQAADEAEVARDPASAALLAQAGNAALADGNATRARALFDSALARGLPDGMEKGEVYLDRARARVSANDTAGAREDIDLALEQVPTDPLGWLLSATLARRTGNLSLARSHIAKAVKLSPDDAAVALEEGNIAVLSGVDDVAQHAWERAIRVSPDSAAGKSAAEQLTRLRAEPTR